jgi:hypothetical protein
MTGEAKVEGGYWLVVGVLAGVLTREAEGSYAVDGEPGVDPMG